MSYHKKRKRSWWPLITYDELANLIRMNHRTIRRFARNREGFPEPIQLHQRRVLFDIEEVYKWIERETGEAFTSEEKRNLDFFMTPLEVSDLIGVHPKTLSRWNNNHLFPKPLKLSPKHFLYMKKDVDGWIDGKIFKKNQEACL